VADVGHGCVRPRLGAGELRGQARLALACGCELLA
jgi:hypothetical protein